MSVTSTECRESYAGDGVTTSFPVPFQFMAITELKVIKTDDEGVETVLVLNTDYTATGGSGASGNIETEEAPAVGETLTIINDPQPTQALDLLEYGNLPAEAVEAGLDRLAMVAGRARDIASRGLRLADGSDEDGEDFIVPDAETRKGKYLAFDPTTAAPFAAEAEVPSAPVSSFGATFIAAVSASAANTLLGMSTYFKTLLAAADASAIQTLLGISTFVKTLLSAASASAFRTLIGVSTDYQSETVSLWTAYPNIATNEWGDLDSIILPAGTWDLSFHANVRQDIAAAVGRFIYMGLGTSTGNVAPTLGMPTLVLDNQALDTTDDPSHAAYNSHIGGPFRVTIGSPTTYYLKAKGDLNGQSFDYTRYQYGSLIQARRIA